MEHQQQQAAPSPPGWNQQSMVSCGQKSVPSTHPLAAATSEQHVAWDHRLLSAIVSREWQEHPEGDSCTQLQTGWITLWKPSAPTTRKSALNRCLTLDQWTWVKLIPSYGILHLRSVNSPLLLFSFGIFFWSWHIFRQNLACYLDNGGNFLKWVFWVFWFCFLVK